MIYSASRQKTFNRCKRYYYFHYILGYREITKSPWLIYGTKFDELLAIYDVEGYESALNAIRTKFLNAFDAYDTTLLLEEYHKKLGNKPLPPIQLEGQPGNQFKFHLKVRPHWVKDCDIETLGYLDKVCDNNGYPAIVERKTTSANINYSAPYWDGLVMDKQVCNYSYAVSDIIGGQVNTVFYEVVRKLGTSVAPCFNRRNKDKEWKTIEEYIEGVEKWLATTKSKKDLVVRRKLWITQEMRDSWLMDLLADDDMMKTMELNTKSYEGMGVDGRYAWPRNQHSCDMYGGCIFRDVCEGKCDVNELSTVTRGE
jgi:hypothetical protein